MGLYDAIWPASLFRVTVMIVSTVKCPRTTTHTCSGRAQDWWTLSLFILTSWQAFETMDYRTALSISYSKWCQRGGCEACTHLLSSLSLIKDDIFQRKFIFNRIIWGSYLDWRSRTNEYALTFFPQVTRKHIVRRQLEKVRFAQMGWWYTTI